MDVATIAIVQLYAPDKNAYGSLKLIECYKWFQSQRFTRRHQVFAPQQGCQGVPQIFPGWPLIF
jgi:hypothetical protein